MKSEIIAYDFIKWTTLQETKGPTRLTQAKLPYDKGDLDPSLSEETIDYHYGQLYKAYVDRYNKGEGDADFNEAGAFLHSIYFSQFRSPKGSNKPEGNIEEFINDHFKSWNDFKEEFLKVAMGIQGSGWVYLSRNGQIKTIKNHQIKKDIVILIDWWEHAWALDYQSHKDKYLEGQWKIINWDFINTRIADLYTS
jgi:Fe-Mn family superoxide dismutase